MTGAPMPGTMPGTARASPIPGRNLGLDLLRLAAIGMVLANHAFLLFLLWPGVVGWHGLPAFASTLSTFGIEWLFGLSGFLIGAMLISGFAKQPTRWRAVASFWTRRWFRTVPNYYLFVAVNLALVGLGVEQGRFQWRFLWFAQNLVRPFPQPALFGESWSLALDEWFYFVLPLLVAAALAVGARHKHAFLAGIAVLIAVPTVARGLVAWPDAASWDEHVRTVTLYHLDATGWGVLAAWTLKWRPEAWYARASAVRLGVALLALCALMLEAFTFRPGLVAAFPRLWTTLPLTLSGAGTFLCLPWVCARPPAGPRVALPVARLSDWTYSLYLSHMPVGFAVRHLLGDRVGLAAQAAVWLLATVAISAGIHYAFEKPVMDLRERFTQRQPAGPFSNPAPPP